MAAVEQARAAMAANYKALKEDFVSNLTGGDILEINYVTAVAPVAVMLWSVLQTRHSFFTPYTPLAFVVDFLLNVGGILLATTLYASTPILLNLLLIGPAVLLFIIPQTTPRSKKAKPPVANRNGGVSKREASLDPLPKKPFVTTYRGCMMVVTCIAILAVDFRIFPRRFAKVENWGTSLMDLGVGSFVFSAGLVGARPVLQSQITHERKTPGLHIRLYKSLRHSLPLLVLGFIRLYSVKGLDYAEHVTEYGVHWNFFFTLGFLPPFVAIFQTLLNYIPSYPLLSLLLSIAYQLLLQLTPLQPYILIAPRTSLFSSNREGIFSFFGYLAIFLAGQGTGMLALPRNVLGMTLVSRLQLDRVRYQVVVLGMLGAWCGVYSLLYMLTTSYHTFNLTPSRRLANLPYVLWVCALNCGQLFLFCLIETIFFPVPKPKPSQSTNPLITTKEKEEEEIRYNNATPRVLKAFNRNGLAIFLLANLLTGLVNLSIPTLMVDEAAAMGILVGYVGVVSFVAVGLDWWEVSIKL